jgi:hypothetical protein
MDHDPLLPRQKPLQVVNSDQNKPQGPVATRDHEVIKQWARDHQAEPATGQATSSGPASSFSVQDGGAGIRFNFPGVSTFRQITWGEWLEHFDQHQLTFVYEEPSDNEPMSPRYRIVKTSEWAGQLR